MRSIIYGTEAYSTRLPRTGREGAICYFELFWGRVCFCDFALVGDMIPALMGGGLGFVRFHSGVPYSSTSTVVGLVGMYQLGSVQLG